VFFTKHYYDDMSGHAVCMEGKENANRILIGDLQERDLGDLAVDGEVIVKWIFRK
jgi:hypothetical protein